MHISSCPALEYVNLLQRYNGKRLSWKSLFQIPKWGFLGDYSPWEVPWWRNPKRHILGLNRIDWHIICGGRAPGISCARAREEKKFTVVNNFTHMGRRDRLTDLGQIWRTWWSRLRYQLCQFWCWSVQRFYSVKGRKWPFHILKQYRLNTVQIATAPTPDVTLHHEQQTWPPVEASYCLRFIVCIITCFSIWIVCCSGASKR
jgi:hypothetical protein